MQVPLALARPLQVPLALARPLPRRSASRSDLG